MKRIFTYMTILLLLAGCASSEKKNAYRGTAIGATAGGVAGALIGGKTGAIIGAGVGGVGGAVIGSRMDRQANELKKVAETKRTDEGLITKLKSDILFDSGKAELKPTAKRSLQDVAEIMKKYPENVLTVNGYTDITGSSAFNEALSERRAQAVKAQLVASGLPESTITSYGKGPSNPVADNDSSTGRQQNRRVEIEVRADASRVPAGAQ